MKYLEKNMKLLERKKYQKISKKAERRNRDWKRRQRRAIIAYEDRMK